MSKNQIILSVRVYQMGKKLIQKIISKQSLISMSLERVFLFTKYDESVVHRLSKTFCIPFNPNWHVDGLLALQILKKLLSLSCFGLDVSWKKLKFSTTCKLCNMRTFTLVRVNTAKKLNLSQLLWLAHYVQLANLKLSW